MKTERIVTKFEMKGDATLCEELKNFQRDYIDDLIQQRYRERNEFIKEKMKIHLKWYHKLFILLNKKSIVKYVKCLEQHTTISELSKLGVQIYDKQYWMYE